MFPCCELAAQTVTTSSSLLCAPAEPTGAVTQLHAFTTEGNTLVSRLQHKGMYNSAEPIVGFGLQRFCQSVPGMRWTAVVMTESTSRLSRHQRKSIWFPERTSETSGWRQKAEAAMSPFYLFIYFHSIPELAVMQRATQRTLISRAAFGSAGRIYGNWERWGFPLMDRET